jgi:hypothetical protein
MAVEQIDNYFFKSFGGNFVNFHDNRLAGKAYYTGVNINDLRFSEFWREENLKNVYGRSSINVVEFLTLHNIIVKETGGEYRTSGEIINGMSVANPGISYLFNKISGKKMSYNTKRAGNKTCLTLFNDPDFISEHGSKPLGSLLSNTTDSRWGGELFPYSFDNIDDNILCSAKDEKNGFILQADFYKFRGRGFIQTTGRGNYKKIVEFIIKYSGNSREILNYQSKWSVAPYNNNVDIICTRSTDRDWSILFKNMEIAGKAISLHSKDNGNYLTMPLDNVDPDKLNDMIYTTAYGVNKSKEYCNLIVNRVLQTIQAMGL